MKITIQHYKEEISLSTKHDDLTSDDTVELMYRMCLAMGYYPTCVAEAFEGLADQLIKLEDSDVN
jgi:hypothetical protein